MIGGMATLPPKFNPFLDEKTAEKLCLGTKSSFRLDPARKRAWLEELRSGLYKQGASYLYRGGVYCCLGVFIEACELEWEERLSASYPDVWGEATPDGAQSSFLDSRHIPDPIQKYLGAANDSGATFKQIANWIEVYL
jgi:hypothetical protein